MRYSRYPYVRLALPVLALGLGAMLFLPGSQTAGVVTETVADTPDRPLSYLASPQLIAELDAAVTPAIISDNETLAREATRPDPTATNVAVTPEVPEAAPAIDPATALHVGDNAVNMRVGPSSSTDRIATLQPGQKLTFGEMSGGWAQVTTADGESGWVFASYLVGPAVESARAPDAASTEARVADVREPQPAADEPAAGTGRYARIKGDVVLRAGPSRDAESLFVLPSGERVAIVDVQGRWARIVLRSGASGWVRLN